MLLLVLPLLAILTVLSATDFTPTIGIHLSTSRLTSAYISTDGKPMPLASISGGQAYQEYMASAVLKDQNGGPVDTTAVASQLFSTAIERIRSVTAVALESSMNITAITVPDYLDEDAFGAVVAAASSTLPSFMYPYQAQRLTSSARLAYHLNTCEGLGLDPQTCDVDEGPNFVLFVDLNSHHLEVALANVLEDTVGIEDRISLLTLGAEPCAKNNEKWVADLEGLLREFVSRNFVDRSPQNDLQYLLAIVVSGEADKATMEELKTVLGDVLPEQKGLIRDMIAPEYVGAVGAAYWAKLQVDRPEMFWNPNHDYEFQHIHDEL